MKVSFSLQELIAIVQPLAVRGATNATIVSIASLDAAVSGDLSFLGNPKYRPQVATTKASVVLLPADHAGEPPEGQAWLCVKNPSAALGLICARIEQSLWPKPAAGIHPSAVVASSAKVDPSATVGPLCVVEDDAVVGARTHLQARVHIGRAATVGADCWLMSGVTLSSECELGDRVRLQPGVVIGSDGFGYEFVNGRHEKIPQVGSVVVGNDVEIGANTTIDRARFSRTVIGEGTKIDNLVQIGHNVVIGKHCILCAHVGISGSTTLEDYVVLAGQVGVAGHLTIGKGSRAGGQCGINSSIPPASYITGTPCLPFQKDRRINILRERLPELFKRVDALEQRVGASPEAPASGEAE